MRRILTLTRVGISLLLLIHSLGGQAFAANNPPTAHAGTDQTVSFGEIVTLDGAGSADPEGNPLTYTWLQVGGTPITLNNPNTARPTFISSIPNQNLVFNLTVQDNGGLTRTDSVSVTVLQDPQQLQISYPGVPSAGTQPVRQKTEFMKVESRVLNHGPLPTSQTLSTPSGQALNIILSATDQENNPLSFSTRSMPLNGTLTLSGASAVYTPAPGFSGRDTFFFRVNDSQGAPAIGAININVGSFSNAPATPLATTLTAGYEEPTSFILQANDPESRPMTFAVLPPLHGTTMSAGPNAAYTPFSSYSGPDYLPYIVTDNAGNKSGGVVLITVNPARIVELVARLDNATTGPVVGTATPGYGIQSFSLDFTGHPNGSHNVHFRATDIHNKTSVVSGIYLVDNVRPTIQWVPETPYENQVVKGDVSFSVRVTDNHPLNIGSVRLMAPAGEISFQVTGDPNVFTSEIFDTNLFGDGTFTFTAIADDLAPNASQPIFRSIVVDNSGPETTLDLTPAPIDSNGLQIAKGQVTVDATAWDGGAGLSNMKLFIESGNVQTKLKETATESLRHILNTEFYPVHLNPWKLRLEATDLLGNVSNKTVNLTFDNWPPSVGFWNLYEGLRVESLPVGTDIGAGDPMLGTGIASVEMVVNGVVIATQRDAVTPSRYRTLTAYTQPGPATVIARATDRAGNVGTSTPINIVVNSAPQSSNLDLTIQEEESKNISLLIYDADGDSINTTILSGPQNGSLFWMGYGGNYLYIPNNDFNGIDQFTFNANDGIATGNTATVTVTVNPGNDYPMITNPNQTYNTNEDVPVDITFDATDVDGDPLTFTIVSHPLYGTLSGTGASRTYSPNPNSTSADQFTYRVTDGIEAVEGSVSITINPVSDIPVAVAQNLATPANTAKNLVLMAYDADFDAISPTIVTPPTHGTLTPAFGFHRTYTPHNGYTGTDFFEFRVFDGVYNSNIARVTITVGSSNQAPVAQDDSIQMNEDEPRAVTLTATDPEGAPLSFRVVQSPAQGTLSGTVPNLIYTPSSNFYGYDSFSFMANDGLSDSHLASIQIQIDPVDDAPVAENLSVSLLKNNGKQVILSGTDIELGQLSYSIVTGPTHGSLIDPRSVPNLRVYIPNQNYTGSDSFTYRVNDGGLDSVPATVTLDILPTNNAPIADSLSVNVAEDSNVALSISASDSDNDELTYTVINPPVNGTLTGTFPNIEYTPKANFVGGDIFTFRANDGTVNSNIASVNITVEAVNDLPTILSSTLSNGDVVGFFSTWEMVAKDIDGQLGAGRVTVNGSGCQDVGPDSTGKYVFGFCGLLEFGQNTVEIQISDNLGGTVSRTITVTADFTGPQVSNVTPANNAELSGTVNLHADFSDNFKLLSGSIYIDGIQVATQTYTGATGSINYAWDTTSVPNGQHQLIFQTVDAQQDGNGVIRTVTVNNLPLQNPAPQVDILMPLDLQSVKGAVPLKMQVTGNVTSAGFVIDGGIFIAAGTNSPGIYEYVWNTSGLVSDGFHVIEYIAVNQGVETRKAIQVRVDNTAPTVSVVSPAANSVAFQILNLQVNASDGAHRLSSVNFAIDGGNVASFSGQQNPLDTGYSHLLDTAITNGSGQRIYPDGSHNFVVTVVDEAGNSTQLQTSFIITNGEQPPAENTHVILTPDEGAFVVSESQIQISAQVTDAVIDPVIFSQNPQSRLVVSVVKDGNTIAPFPGTVQLVNGDTVVFQGDIPANSTVECTLSVTVSENSQLKNLTRKWSFTRGFNSASAVTIRSADGLLTLTLPANALDASSVVTINTVTNLSQELEDANAAFAAEFAGQKVVYGPFEIAARSASGVTQTALKAPAILSYNPPAQNSDSSQTVSQIQRLDGTWKPVQAGGIQSAAVSPANTPINTLGIFRITTIAAPGDGITQLYNYPNPFSPSEGGTDFAYLLGSDSDVRVVIYDLFGGLVLDTEVTSGAAGATLGQNLFHWDGRNGQGETVANGGYIAHIYAKDSSGKKTKAIRKVAVVK